MEVPLVLHGNYAGAGVDVSQDCAFPASPVLILLPTPFWGEAIPDTEAVPEDLVLEFRLDTLCAGHSRRSSRPGLDELSPR
jgi:hypothetical protein